MPKRKVFILNSDHATDQMFRSVGWEIVKNPTQADMFQFTGSGSSDVTPSLYKEAQHRMTHPDPGRDKMEAIYYQIGRKLGVPMAGICRGGQFLNVMNGGWLWQHVNNHHTPHYVEDVTTGEVYLASSEHHQMMRVPRGAVTLAVAGESTFREFCVNKGVERSVGVNPKKLSDPEVVWFPDTRCLAVQYHPEWQGFNELAGRYFDLIEQYLFNSKH
jgi:gamma-glutamyl-gamma-aminobutyrate hydrolase PuuD